MSVETSQKQEIKLKTELEKGYRVMLHKDDDTYPLQENQLHRVVSIKLLIHAIFIFIIGIVMLGLIRLQN